MNRPLFPLSLAAALVSGGLAAAQQGPPSYAGQPPQGPQPDGPPDMRAALRLRPDQEAAFRAFMSATQPSRAQMDQDRQEGERLAILRTPERLDMIAAKMARDQASFRAQAAAVKRFYAALSPEQQQTFDRLTAPPADDGQEGGSPADQGPPGGYAPQPRR